MINLQVLISLVATIIGFLISTITFIIKFFKNAKAKTLAENCISIRDVLLGYIAEAETFANYTGQQKKEFVIQQIINYAQENGLMYDVTRVSDKIDEVVALTKLVNKKTQG